MHWASLGLGYWTARVAIPLLTLGRMRVQSPDENLSGDKRVLAKGSSAVFGAFLFAAAVTGVMIVATGGQL